jgi:predicted Zn-dependent peptidase
LNALAPALSDRSMLRVIVAACVLALPFVSHAAERASSLKPLAFVEYDLPNGLHVILHENHAAPVVSTYVLYHVGSKNERPDRTGFAHFFEHLMFEGSDNIPRKTIDKYISGAGGNLNASTSFDRTDYFFNLPSNQLKLALWIESERMMHSRIDETGVETQRQVVKEERRMRYDNQPYGSMFEKLCGLVFKGTPYEWTPIGSAQYIDQATIEEFRAFWKQYYLPNNAILAIAGDIKVEETKKLVEEYFGGIPKGPEPPRPTVKLPEVKEPQSLLVQEDKTPLPATLHAWIGCEQTHPDAYPLDLLANILANGQSSRLYRRLVDQEQVALAAQALPILFEKAGVVGVFATGQRGVPIAELDKLIADEVEKVKANGVTEEEFKKALNQKEAELANQNGTMLARARNLANAHLFFGDTNEVNKELDRYLAVKREDLQRVAKQYLASDKVHIVRYTVPEAPKLDPKPTAPTEGKPAPAGAETKPAPAAKKDNPAEQSADDLRKRKRAAAPKAAL